MRLIPSKVRVWGMNKALVRWKVGIETGWLGLDHSLWFLHLSFGWWFIRIDWLADKGG